MYAANLPYDRLKKYLETLTEKGLVKTINENNRTLYALTIKGTEFLKELKRMKNSSKLWDSAYSRMRPYLYN